MQKYVMEGDGNCCFSAVAFSLISNSYLLHEQHKHHLQSLGLDVSDIGLKLRQITVNEWIQHSSMYEGFLIDVSIEREAPKFFKPGYFHGI